MRATDKLFDSALQFLGDPDFPKFCRDNNLSASLIFELFSSMRPVNYLLDMEEAA